MAHNETLQALFLRYRDAYPELLTHTKPIASGGQGLVVADKDDAAIKIVHRNYHAVKNGNPLPAAHTHNELTTLKFLAGQGSDMLYPCLIDDAMPFSYGPASTAYRMTRLKGESSKWVWDQAEDYPHVWTGHFKNAGRLLALFHARASAMPAGLLQSVPSVLGRHGGLRAPHVAYLDDDANAALKIVDDFLQDSPMPGVAHGDFWGGNIISDSNDTPTGLLDFGYTRHTSNILTDMLSIPDGVMPFFMEGYQEEAGCVIDPMVINAISVAASANQLDWLCSENGALDTDTQHLTTQLRKVKKLTGFTPPSHGLTTHPA